MLDPRLSSPLTILMVPDLRIGQIFLRNLYKNRFRSESQLCRLKNIMPDPYPYSPLAILMLPVPELRIRQIFLQNLYKTIETLGNFPLYIFRALAVVY